MIAMNTGRNHGRRLVLRKETRSESLADFAALSDWEPIGHVPRDPAQGVFLEIIWKPDDDTSVYYVEDEFTNTRFVTAGAPDPGKVEQILADIARHVGVWSLRDMLAATKDKDPQRRMEALLRLGVGSPLRADPSVMKAVRRAAHDPDPVIRRAALWAMVYAEWPEYRDDMVELTHDPDPVVADDASRALRRFIEEGVIDQ